MKIPRPGTRLAAIHAMLPATNREIADAFALHGGEVARIMAGMIANGQAVNLSRRGRGYAAVYARSR
jgi:hypothetical protein